MTVMLPFSGYPANGRYHAEHRYPRVTTSSSPPSWRFAAVSQLPPEERAVVKDVLESLIIKYRARRWHTARGAAGRR